MRSASVLALTASFGVAIAEVYLGFNSGATTDTRNAKFEEDFQKEFETAQKLRGSPGLFNSVRLYTNIQAYTDDTPISAFPAAVNTNTKVLLGIWCSETVTIEKELSALKKGIDQYGTNFTNLVIGISVGSEDLYRVSESGIRNKAGPGQDAETIIGFIQDVRNAIKDTPLSGIPVGHVDTWSSWSNATNSDVIDEVDFLGTNLFPYYEDDKGNDISNITNVFENAINATTRAAGNKPVWITETGFPYEGPTWGQAQATLNNAKTYWDTIGCTLFGRENVFWYTLRDSNPDNKAKFGITGQDLSTTPRFNLTCPANSGAPASINNNPSGNAGTATYVSMMNTLAVAMSIVFALTA